MPAEKLSRFLDAQGVKYVTIRHSRAFTAQEIAEAAHLPGRRIAKTVVVVVDGKMAMVVLRGPDRIDLDRLKAALGADSVALAEEPALADLFPGCELGAMPPFGNLWDLDVFVDQALRQDEHIAFNAGNHTELFQVSYSDFERLVNPVVLELT